MTIVQLQYVLAVDHYKNFTTAAENCYVTQPTLSMQIQKLEDELGIEIFDRASHPIKPTKIGFQIIEQARKIVNESKKIKNIVQEEKGTLEGEFIIGIIPTVYAGLTPLFLKTFLKKYPNIRLVIKELQTKEMIASIKDGSIDIGIVATPLGEEHITEAPLYYEPFIGYVPEYHKLSPKGVLTLKDLDSNDILMLEDGHCFSNSVMNICDFKRSTDKKVNFECGNLDVLIKLCDDGFGMTVLPLLYTEDFPENKKSRLRNFIEPVPTREISLVYHKSMLRVTFINSLKEVIQAVIRGKISLESTGNVISPKLEIK